MKMAPLTRQDLKWLATPHPWPCLSVYAQVKRDGYHAEAFLAQMQDIAASIAQRLQYHGMTSSLVSTFTKPLASFDQLGLEALYRDFQGHRLGGLGFFIAPDGMRGYVSGDELPTTTAIRPHFELRPLLAATCEHEDFFILGASPSEVKLWHIRSQNQGKATPVELPKEVPENQRAFLEHTEFSPKLAYHAVGSGAPGMTVGKWYGTVERDRQDKMLDDYALAIARPISHMLAKSGLPLVLAANGNLAVMLRKHLKIPLLVEDAIPESPAHLSLQDLVQAGWQRIREIENQKTKGELERFKEHLGTPRTASTIDDIWSAATRGQIDILLASSKRDLPVDDERAELVSGVAQETLHRGGKVLLTEDPFLTTACPMGAILRWRA
jgi:hypothetical protein